MKPFTELATLAAAGGAQVLLVREGCVLIQAECLEGGIDMFEMNVE
jgi:hypothetical protein